MGGVLPDAIACDLRTLKDRDLAPVDVAIIDSGVDATHADLISRQITAYDVQAGDGEPQIIKVDDPSNNDSFGHGTAVASIIAGIAPNARLIDLRILGPANTGSGDALVAALARAVAERWRIVNMSLAASAAVSGRLSPLCERAYYQNQLIVAAQRNQPMDEADIGYPSLFSSSVGVEFDTIKTPYEYFFRGGRPIEYIAAGDEVTVAAPGGGYTTRTGTSFATPAITGICALLLGAFPGLRTFEMKTVLKAHAARIMDV
jgi:subtilisin family serine protease